MSTSDDYTTTISLYIYHVSGQSLFWCTNVGTKGRFSSFQMKCYVCCDLTISLYFNQAPGQSLFWRAVLQVILRDVSGGECRQDWQVGKLATKCSDFTQYVYKAMEKLNMQHQVYIHIYARVCCTFHIEEMRCRLVSLRSCPDYPSCPASQAAWAI